MAASHKVSPATVQRIWKKHKLQPHRVESFKFSTDPEFAPKVRDIVGLYMNPPDQAIVLSVDEKSQIQALDRTQPILPLRPGCRATDTRLRAPRNDHPVCRVEHSGRDDYRDCHPSHRHQEFLRFLEADRGYGCHGPGNPPGHGQLRHPQTPGSETVAGRPAPLPCALHADQFLLAEPDRTMVCRNHTETDSPRHLPERPRPGKAIKDYVRHYNRDPRPFQWVASASKIIRKVNKYKETLETGD